MSTIEAIQHVRDIDPDYPACTVLLKGRIIQTLLYYLLPFYSNIDSVGRSKVDYYRSSLPSKQTVNEIFQGFGQAKKAKLDKDTVLF